MAYEPSRLRVLLGLTESFFHSYLQHTREARAHTKRAYRDALKLLYLFIANQKRKPMSDLALEDIQSDAVLSFRVMSNRMGTPRLAGIAVRVAVRCFVQHLLRQDVTRAGQYGRILAIRKNKRAMRAHLPGSRRSTRPVAAINHRFKIGNRDHTLLLFLYNIAARVSEARAVHACDL